MEKFQIMQTVLSIVIIAMFVSACESDPPASSTPQPESTADGNGARATAPGQPAGPVSLTQHWVYDTNDNVTAFTDANGATIRYEYDTDNRLKAVLYPDGKQVTYTYDKIGRRTQMTDSIGTTKYVYDVHGRLTRITDANGQTVEYRYDVTGNATDMVYPGGSVVRYEHNTDNLLAAVTDATGKTTYEYDQAGGLVGRTLPNGITSRYSYDTAHRLVSIAHRDRAGRTLLSFDYYILDAAGRSTQAVETRADGQRLTTSYTYDSLSRLTQATYPDGRAVSYTYDAVGNRLTMAAPEGKTTYTYDLDNRLLSLVGPGGAAKFVYDANGNLTERQTPKDKIRYVYDYENRLVRFDDGASVVEFLYDGDGNRVAKVAGGVRTEYTNNISGLLPQVLLQRAGDKTTRYVLGDRLIAQADGASGEVFFPLEDRLGSVVAIADRNGAVAGTSQYDAFGAASRAGRAEMAFGFTGEQQDQDTGGLLYLRARYYDPATGRFMGKDPLPGTVRDPQSQNGYPYVWNNPANQVDPSGLQPPYPYGRDRYDRLPGYQQEWRRPSDIIGVGRRPEPYFSAPSITSRQIEYLQWAQRRENKWATDIAKRIAESTWKDTVDKFIGRLMPGTFVPGLPGPSIEEKIGHKGFEFVKSTWGFIRETENKRPDNSYAAFLRERMPALPLREFVKREGEVRRAIDRLNRREDKFYVGRQSGGFQDWDYGGGGVSGGGGGGVGGVLLNQSAKVLGDLSDITGATFDPATGQIILIGQKDATLPPMNMDDLVVAVRSVYGDEDPGVTMVPVDPSWKDSTQRVEYFGRTENTRFGWTMFEADRYLKGLAAGKDSLTGAPVVPKVQGFKSETQLSFERKTAPSWHRNWFVPNEIVLKRSDDGQSFAFDKATMRVDSRFIDIATGRDIPGASPITDEFTRFLTAHYSEFAQEKPELAELVRLAKIVGVVRWMRDNHIPVDLSWMANYQVTPVNTPRTTPGVSAKISTPDGTYSIESRGGVSFGTENTYSKDSGQVAALRDRALGERPDTVPLIWNFEQDGKTYIAVALSFAPALVVGGYVTATTDLLVTANGGFPVEFTRTYNSLNLKAGAMGPGWTFMPYALSKQETRQPVSVTEQQKQYQVEQQLVLTAGAGRETFKGPYTDGSGRRFFLPEGSSSSYRDIDVRSDGFLLRRRDGMIMNFTPQGQIISTEDRNRNGIIYHYDGQGRLTAFADRAGRGVTLSYSDGSRLTKATASDGQTVTYAYDTNGRLSSVLDDGETVASYVYDTDDRLVEIRDGVGTLLLKNEYDGLGRLRAQTDATGSRLANTYDRAASQVSSTDQAGNSFTFTRDNGRIVRQTGPLGQDLRYGYDSEGHLTSVTDGQGRATRYSYDQKGNLSRIESPSGATTLLTYDDKSQPVWIIDAENVMTLLKYDERGNVVQITSGLRVTNLGSDGASVRYDPSGSQSLSLSYDGAGNPITVSDARGNVMRMEYDERGLLNSVRSASGSTTHLTFDSHSRLIGIADPIGNALRLAYDDRGHMTGITTAAGTIMYGYDRGGNVKHVMDEVGSTTQFDYGLSGQLAVVVEPTSMATKYEYDMKGNMVAVVYASGAKLQFEYDAKGRMVKEIFPNTGP